MPQVLAVHLQRDHEARTFNFEKAPLPLRQRRSVPTTDNLTPPNPRAPGGKPLVSCGLQDRARSPARGRGQQKGPRHVNRPTTPSADPEADTNYLAGLHIAGIFRWSAR
ncbi:hypothetical protein GCM10010228_03880 [Streptomyces massasporeus]|nr:hypothetical protein GCM10010228_03880 [Streptomyces massasporeus]